MSNYTVKLSKRKAAKYIKARFPKPAGYRSILQYDNAKTSKGESLGYKTGILYLAPGNEAGRGNLCQFMTDGCGEGCLYTSGMASVYKTINEARVAKTHFMFDEPEAFDLSLRYDIEKLVRDAEEEGLIPAVRLNGTSDLAKLGMKYAKLFPDVQFYDYTKLPKAWMRQRPNYHLTFSRSENNLSDVIDALRHHISVAVVFDTKKGKELPAEFMGRQVIDGDLHDLRFLDERGVIVGLRAKGEARKDNSSGFVQITRLTHVPAA